METTRARLGDFAGTSWAAALGASGHPLHPIPVLLQFSYHLPSPACAEQFCGDLARDRQADTFGAGCATARNAAALRGAPLGPC